MKRRSSPDTGLRRLATVLLCALAGSSYAAGPGTLKFGSETFEVAENAGVATIRVERSQGDSGTVTVHYATGGGNATAGLDYTATSGTLTWLSGDSTDKTFTVPILADALVEGSETIGLALSAATGGAAIDATRGTATLIILGNGGGGGGDDGGATNGTLKFDESDFYVTEKGGAGTISVERSNGTAGTVTVQYATSNGTATAGSDYTAVSGTLTWGPGDASRRSFVVPILPDNVADDGETVRLTLSAPTGGAVISSVRASALLHIVEGGEPGDDDGGDPSSRPGMLKFAEATYQVVEGTPNATITVERSSGTMGAASVTYTAASGSAIAGEDFTAVTGTLNWANGDGANKTFQVPIVNDTAAEGNETVRLTLSSPTGATLDTKRASATLTILDNDAPVGACVPNATTACLSGNRFKVQVVFRLTDGTTGNGTIVPISGTSTNVWFFAPDNIEMLIKMVNACALYQRYWVFLAATTNVNFTMTVTDTATGVVKQYTNPTGLAAEPVQDTFTFETCP